MIQRCRDSDRCKVRSQEKEVNAKAELRGIETIRPYEQNPRLSDQVLHALRGT